MKILIDLDRLEPPRGTIALPLDGRLGTAGTSPVAFAGWLDLLCAMYEIVGFTPPPADDGVPPGR